MCFFPVASLNSIVFLSQHFCVFYWHSSLSMAFHCFLLLSLLSMADCVFAMAFIAFYGLPLLSNIVVWFSRYLRITIPRNRLSRASISSPGVVKKGWCGPRALVAEALIPHIPILPNINCGARLSICKRGISHHRWLPHHQTHPPIQKDNGNYICIYIYVYIFPKQA